MTALLLSLCWTLINELHFGPPPPKYPGETHMSHDATLGMLAALSVLALFFSYVSAKLIAALISGRTGRRLLPWWLARGLLFILIGLPLAAAVMGLATGDPSTALRGLLYAVFFGTWWPATRELRTTQRRS